VTKDLMSDSTWIPLQQYQGDGIYKGEIGRFCGMRVVEATQVFRSAVATPATYSGTGNVYHSLMLGKEAFGVTKFTGDGKPRIIVKNPGPGDTSNPLNRYSTVGWALPFVPKALNGNFAIGFLSYH
jgi:N4-gp56 family major capsid protein